MRRDVVGSSSARVLHLLPHEAARGGPIYAHALRRSLDGRLGEHRTLTLFSSDPALSEADSSLAARSGRLRRVGLDPSCLLRLRRLLATWRPTITVAHGGETLKYAALAGRHTGVLVYYAIGLSTDAVDNGPRRAFYRFVVRRADVVAGVSAEALDRVHEVSDVTRESMALIPNGRDPAPFVQPAPASPEFAGLPRPLLLWVGHLTPGKRPEWVIEVVRRLRRDGVPAEAVIVGDGPNLDALGGPAAHHHVRLAGRRHDVADIMRASDVFLFTSTGQGEGMPGVLIEAGMAGLPVVTTAVAGAATVLEQGRTGIIVGRDDFEGYVEAVARVCLDEPLRRAMGDAAKRRCIAEFSLDASVQHWEALLEQLLRTAGAEVGSAIR